MNLNWRLEHFIDGRFEAGTGAAHAAINPATEDVIAEFAFASKAQVDRAVTAARDAFARGDWRDPARRAATLARMAELFAARKEEFLAALVTEIGTPVSISRFLQLDGPLDMLRDIAARADQDWTRRLAPDTRAPASASLVRYAPVGVVAGIGAYNNPLLYLVSKCCAALAAGCTAVYLPSSLTPLSALLFGEIARDAGVPAGVLNIIAGGPDIAQALTEHSGVDKISMTGSVEVGRKVMTQAAAGLKGVVLELGGKSPGIVLPGADIAKAAAALNGRYLRNAGQGCQSPTRLLVPAAQCDEFIACSREVFATLPVGDPFDPATMIGPLISAAHRARVEGFVARAVAAGGEILAGGGRPPIARGWFMNGALIGGLGNEAELACSELFGPVAMLLPYQDVDAAVAIANDSAFGLAASVIGPLDDALAVAQRLQAGTVSINGGGNFRVDSVLAGWKQSGMGCEWGEEGIREFLQPQHIQWIT